MSTVPDQLGRQRRTAIWAGAALLLLAAALYLLTLDNGFAPGELVGGDLITHQYAQVEARPSNAPGYPLYTMGGWAWFHGLRGLSAVLGNPLPNPIPILSSYSTLWAILALGLMYALVLRLTRSRARPYGNWVVAWLIGAFYAVTYFFWYYATTTEQYTSAIAQTLAIVYVYVVWAEAAGVRPERLPADPQAGMRAATAASIGRHEWTLVLLAFLCGLSLAHMLTVAFIVPPLVVAIIWQEPRVLRNWRLVALCVLAAFLPLASYWYVWVRGTSHPEWWGQGEWGSAQAWFWSFVSTAQGRDELSRGFKATCAFFDNGFPELTWQELSIPLLAIGVAGIALLRKPLALVLYATLIIYVVFDWMYRCANWYQVILPAYPLVLLGVAAAAERVQIYFELQGRKWAAYLPAAILIAAIAWRGATAWERADSSDRPEDTALARAGVLVDQPLPPNASLFAATGDALALEYLAHIWGIRPDLTTVSSAEAGKHLAAGETVFTTYDAAPVLLSELPVDLPVRRAGAGPDWLALNKEAPEMQREMQANPTQASATPALRSVEQDIVPGVILKGYAVTPAPDGKPVTAAPPGADVTLYWGLLGDWPSTLGISLRPTQGGSFVPDPSGAAGAIVQVDAPAPLHGLAAAGDTAIADSYRIPMPPGADGILLIVYEKTADGFRNLLELPLPRPQ
ncbi:MAG: DUF2723 domain-containing protein [Caldilineaceae bacterium]